MLLADKKVYKISGDEIMELNTEKKYSIKTIGEYDEKWLEESIEKQSGKMDIIKAEYLRCNEKASKS